MLHAPLSLQPWQADSPVELAFVTTSSAGSWARGCCAGHCSSGPLRPLAPLLLLLEKGLRCRVPAVPLVYDSGA